MTSQVKNQLTINQTQRKKHETTVFRPSRQQCILQSWVSLAPTLKIMS